jgi:hypothetical protein
VMQAIASQPCEGEGCLQHHTVERGPSVGCPPDGLLGFSDFRRGRSVG